MTQQMTQGLQLQVQAQHSGPKAQQLGTDQQLQVQQNSGIKQPDEAQPPPRVFQRKDKMEGHHRHNDRAQFMQL